MITCCIDCHDRHLNCHSVCPAYTGQKAVLEKQKEEYRKKYLVEQGLTEQLIRSVTRSSKGCNKKWSNNK